MDEVRVVTLCLSPKESRRRDQSKQFHSERV